MTKNQVNESIEQSYVCNVGILYRKDTSRTSNTLMN